MRSAELPPPEDTVRARVVDKPCSELRPWDLCRVPSDRKAPVLGYRVCCPACGFVTLSVAGDDGQAIYEGQPGLTLSQPVECLYCGARVLIEYGEMVLLDGDHVHPTHLS